MFKYCILILSLLFAVFFKTKRSLHMLQQNLYNENNRYLKWIFKNYGQFLDLDIILVLVSLIGAFVFYDSKSIALIGLIVLIVGGLLIGFNWINRINNDQNKKPLVITARIKRLMITIFILYFVPLCFMSYYISMKLDFSAVM